MIPKKLTLEESQQLKRNGLVDFEKYPVTNDQFKQLQQDREDEKGFDIETISGSVKLKISDIDVLQGAVRDKIRLTFAMVYK